MKSVVFLTFSLTLLIGLFGMAQDNRKRLKKEQLLKLLNSNQYMIRNDLKSSLDLIMDVEEHIIQLENGNLILVDNDRNGVLYNRLEDLLVVLERDLEENENYTFDSGFLKQIPQLIRELSERLSAPLSAEDRIDKLIALDESLRKVGFEDVEDKYLTNLIAYCGQVLANETEGVWEIHHSETGDYPIIKAAGKSYNFCYKIMDEYYDAPQNFSFSAMIEQVIDPFELGYETGNK